MSEFRKNFSKHLSKIQGDQKMNEFRKKIPNILRSYWGPTEALLPPTLESRVQEKGIKKMSDLRKHLSKILRPYSPRA